MENFQEWQCERVHKHFLSSGFTGVHRRPSVTQLQSRNILIRLIPNYHPWFYASSSIVNTAVSCVRAFRGRADKSDSRRLCIWATETGGNFITRNQTGRDREAEEALDRLVMAKILIRRSKGESRERRGRVVRSSPRWKLFFRMWIEIRFVYLFAIYKIMDEEK